MHHVRFREGLGVRFPRATRLVVLCRYNVRPIFDRMAAVLAGLGLTLNPDKTRILTAAEEGFTFLGFTTQVRKNPRTGKAFPLITPSKKAVGRIKKEIKDVTCRKNLALERQKLSKKDVTARRATEKQKKAGSGFHPPSA